MMLVASNGQSSDTLYKEDLIIVRSGIFVYESIENGVDLSGTYIRDYLLDLGFEVVYANHFPSTLIGFENVFVSFGSGYYSGQVLNETMANTIIAYGQQGGNIYLEGAKALGIDQAGNNSLWSIFGLENVENGAMNTLNQLQGQEGSIMNGIEFTASNQFDLNNIDIYEPDPNLSSAIIAFQESDYGKVAVQYNETGLPNHKSFCLSYSLANLEDGEFPNTRHELLERICNFFDIDSTSTTVNSQVEEKLEMEIYPNPTNQKSIIEFNLQNTGLVRLVIYNAIGQEITNLISGQLNAGIHKIEWNADGLGEGIYFCLLKTKEGIQMRKIIKL